MNMLCTFLLVPAWAVGIHKENDDIIGI